LNQVKQLETLSDDGQFEKERAATSIQVCCFLIFVLKLEKKTTFYFN